MTVDVRLLALLVCPVCKGPLDLRRDATTQAPSELVCPADRLGYPIRDGLPVMLEGEARSLAASGDAAAP